MTIQQRTITAETVTAGACLPWIIRAKAHGASQGFGLERSLASLGAPDEVVSRIKTAVGGATTSSDLSGSSPIVGAFIAGLAEQSILARMFADNAVQKVPLRTRLVGLNSDLSASVVSEGKAIPVSALDLEGKVLSAFKVASMAVLSDELWQDVTAEGQAYVINKLREAVSLAADAALFTRLTVSGTTSATQTTASLLGGDLSGLMGLLNAVHVRGGSRLYWAVSPSAANTLAVADTGGRLSPFAGEMLGLPTTITGGLSGRRVALINGRAVGGQITGVDISASNTGSIQMDDAPTADSTTPTATGLLSLFQANATAVKATFTLAAEPIRDDAVAFLELTGA
ncbi:phage major capsid protein [Pseudoruegeria sp. SK021]|uniref:phage major capsid protein n=1 Tax=Pseudoruegeria sp. SK021 TaxID=1933035 RepID=UPI000A22A8EC|nr:phage major capsid protein [Pseudoruegeria sp. SK021]OSP53822.1 hypothetical protein BV911_15765 [Pseudoruegeria sp. SK021]